MPIASHAGFPRPAASASSRASSAWLTAWGVAAAWLTAWGVAAAWLTAWGVAAAWLTAWGVCDFPHGAAADVTSFESTSI
jgi:hypothetical protein